MNYLPKPVDQIINRGHLPEIIKERTLKVLYNRSSIRLCTWSWADAGDDGQISLRPKSFAVLHLLTRSADRLFSHDKIARTIWPDIAVSDESIVQCVRDIRRATGGDAEELIRTLPKRGYMLTSPAPPTTIKDHPLLGCSR